MKKVSSIGLIIFALLSFSCTSKYDGRTRIVIWHTMPPDERQFFEMQLKQYMQNNPNVVVQPLYKEPEEMRSGYIIAAIAGQGPDLVYGPSDNIGPFQVMDIIMPLDDLFEKEWLASFNPKGLIYYKGHLYQIADKLGNHLILVYNKDLVPTPPQTDEELIALGEKLTRDGNGDGKIDTYGLVWNYTEPFFFIPFYTGFGGWVMDDNGNPTLDNQAMVDGLKFLQDLRDVYKIIPKEADYNTADVLFKEKRAAMLINGDWSWIGYKNAGVNFSVAPLPKITKTGLWCAPMVASRGFSINVNIDKAKLPVVLDFLKFIMDPAQQLEATKALNTIPTRTVLYDNSIFKENDILKNSQMQIERGKPMPIIPELRAVWDAMRPSYQAVLGGTIKPEQAAKEMQALAMRKIAEMNE
jgi:maltose-binding protein MalE